MFLNLDLLIEYPQKGNANNTKSTQRKATEKAKRYSIHWITASHDLWRIGQLLADCRQFLLDDLTTLRQTHQRVRVALLLLAAFHIVQCRLQHRLHSSTIAAYTPTTERAQERWCRQHCYREFHLVSWCLTSLFGTNIWLYLCLLSRLDHTAPSPWPVRVFGTLCPMRSGGDHRPTLSNAHWKLIYTFNVTSNAFIGLLVSRDICIVSLKWLLLTAL